MAEDRQTYVRIPPRLLQILDESRLRERRSLTQEIIYRLDRDAQGHGETKKLAVA